MISGQTLCTIRNIQKSIERLEVVLIEKVSLSLSEVMLLFCLEQNGKCCSGDIAKYVEHTKSNTSKTLCILENKKLIKRSISSADHRQMYFELTVTGLKKLEALKQTLSTDQEPLKTLLQGVN